MSKQTLFADRPVGAVTLVETPVSRSFARKARLAFLATAVVGSVLLAVVLSLVIDPVWAVALGIVCGAAAGLVVGTVVRVWPVLRVLWHWSAEIAAAGLVLASLWLLAQVTHPLVMVAAVALATVLGTVIGPTRRWLVAWGWCAVVRHRLRLCFAEFIRSTNRVRPGSLPLILLARPTRAGERVWVWLRPGLELADLDGKAGKLAVACWAGQVRVAQASERFAALVRIDVTRRDPLTDLVAAPLAASVPDQVVSVGAVPLWSLALNLRDVPEELPAPRVGGRR